MVGIAGGCEAIEPIEGIPDSVIRLKEFQNDFASIASAENQIIQNQVDSVVVVVT